MAQNFPSGDEDPQRPYFPEGGSAWSRPGVQTETNLWAIASLVSGILAWLGLFGLGGVVAVIAGHVAKSRIRENPGTMEGDSLATAGLVLGYANIAVTLIGLCLAVLVVLGVIGTPLICIPFFNLFSR